MSKQALGLKLALDAAADAAALLLANYSFDLGRYKAAELVEQWLTSYPADWVLLATIEALYQGRYKAKSVEQILTIWTRRQQPLYHFNQEFERLICRKLPAALTFEGELETYRQEASNKSNVPTEIATGKTDAGNKETIQYVSPFDAMSGASVAIAPSNLDPTETIPPQRSETESDNVPSLPSEYGNLTVADSWETRIGPIDQFEPAKVDSHLYTKLKTLADSVEERVGGN
ncbi:MAG TPA: hypothetical protein DDW76_35875 [Cyanobacteria bacterium UBA11369]|nr:hypothetical protein [Cyanobacteria bacterium UBA11371]HBE31358.1 hypothetical protein [Cyanobacteria bacterium UBA11368]HBE53989.1 hypothetical protein [Cyanobacteria bacterium UBA11369]